jgi:hypothetical protein
LACFAGAGKAWGCPIGLTVIEKHAWSPVTLEVVATVPLGQGLVLAAIGFVGGAAKAGTVIAMTAAYTMGKSFIVAPPNPYFWINHTCGMLAQTPQEWNPLRG